MAEQELELVEQDPEEVKVLRAINRDEVHLGNVDWKTYLSNLVMMIGLMENPPSHIGFAWALLQEIDDFTKRADILGKWQDLAPKCFPTHGTADGFIADMDCLIRIYSRLRGLVLMQGAKMPHTYDNADGGKGLNELALVWADQYVTAANMISLASEIHNTISAGVKVPMIEPFLYSSRNYNKMPFDNIYDFSRNLFMAESYRQYLTAGKMYTSAPLSLADIKRKLRNACFDEYIRLRIAQIEAEMENDNLLLLDPTIDDIYQELYEQERSVVTREEMFEGFRGSQAYSDRWYMGRPDVLRMNQYFIKYLKWKMEHLHDDKIEGKTIIQGDYVVGNKIMGDIMNVAAGGIGKQANYSTQLKATDDSVEPEQAENVRQETEQIEMFKYIHYYIIDNNEKLRIHKAVCNIVRLPKMQQVVDALKELMEDNRVLRTIKQDAMLTELRRMGLPDGNTPGFSDNNFFSTYKNII